MAVRGCSQGYASTCVKTPMVTDVRAWTQTAYIQGCMFICMCVFIQVLAYTHIQPLYMAPVAPGLQSVFWTAPVVPRLHPIS